MIKKWLLSLCLALSLVGVAACGSEDGEGEASGKQDSQQEQKQGEQAQGPQPDLEGVPEVVAEVNGEEISKAEFAETYKGQFQQLAMQSQASGQKLDQEQLKKQVVESMIGTELLVQEAESRGYKASDKNVNQTLNELAQQNGMKSGDQFMAALKKQGMKEKDIRSDLQTQVKVDQLIAEEAGNTEPTEAEMRKLYDQISAQQQGSGQGSGQGKLPPFEKVKPQLREQAKSQKEGEVAQALISDFRKKADVKINL